MPKSRTPNVRVSGCRVTAAYDNRRRGGAVWVDGPEGCAIRQSETFMDTCSVFVRRRTWDPCSGVRPSHDTQPTPRPSASLILIYISSGRRREAERRFGHCDI